MEVHLSQHDVFCVFVFFVVVFSVQEPTSSVLHILYIRSAFSEENFTNILKEIWQLSIVKTLLLPLKFLMNHVNLSRNSRQNGYTPNSAMLLSQQPCFSH